MKNFTTLVDFSNAFSFAIKMSLAITPKFQFQIFYSSKNHDIGKCHVIYLYLSTNFSEAGLSLRKLAGFATL